MLWYHRYDNCVKISLTACALNRHNNTFLDSCKSEGLISLICALNSLPAPTAALFLVLSSLPSYAVSWKHKSGAYTVLVSTGWCKRGCLSLLNEHEQQGSKRSVRTQWLRYSTCKQFQPNRQTYIILVCAYVSAQHGSISTITRGGSQLDILFSGPKWAAAVRVPLSVLVLYLLLCI